MSVETPHERPPWLEKAWPWLLAFLCIVVAVLITWVILSLFTGGAIHDEAGLTPGVPPSEAEVPVPPPASLTTPPVTPPVTPPATPPNTTGSAEEALVDRYRLGERQGHDPSNDDRRATYGEIGAHCFVGEECGDVPTGAEAVNEAVAGTAGFGSSVAGSGIGSPFGGGSGGSAGSGGTVSILGGGGNADTAASRSARRAPQGQVGSHCFVGETCPTIPDAPRSSTNPNTRTLSGAVVPCGELGVHSRVGHSTPCANGVISRVGTRVETLPTGTTVGLEGRCYMVTDRTTVSATVVAIPCPATTTRTVSAG